MKVTTISCFHKWLLCVLHSFELLHTIEDSTVVQKYAWREVLIPDPCFVFIEGWEKSFYLPVIPLSIHLFINTLA